MFDFKSLLTSRRIVMAIAAVLAVIFKDRFGVFVDETQLTHVLLLIAGWITGDAIMPDLPQLPAGRVGALFTVSDKWKALLQSPRFIATAAGIIVVIGNSRLNLNLTEDQVSKIVGVIITIVVGVSVRPPVAPPA